MERQDFQLVPTMIPRSSISRYARDSTYRSEYAIRPIDGSGVRVPRSDDSSPDKWAYHAHTKAKHDMLASYLDGWYPKLASWQGKLLFLDGFAGRGRYETGEEGSPLIALKRLLDHRSFPSWQARQREFLFYFIEANEDNAASLEEELANLKASRDPWPTSVNYRVIHGSFDDVAAEIVQRLEEQKRRLAPTFAFIDPFGYTRMPMELLAKFLAYPQTEIFVNFMVGQVHRFIERDGQENAMRALFGMDVQDILADFDGEDRVEHLRQVYARQLQDRVGFKYVQSFAMINKTGNILYYLLHGTRHPRGVELMKDAMWKVDPGGGFTFSDRLANQHVLFTPEPDLRPLRRELLTHYAGQRVLINDIEDYTLIYTPYRKKHVREVLKPLEREGVITREGGTRAMPRDKTWISFPN
jgi:three-Cys-motif partner protein